MRHDDAISDIDIADEGADLPAPLVFLDDVPSGVAALSSRVGRTPTNASLRMASTSSVLPRTTHALTVPVWGCTGAVSGHTYGRLGSTPGNSGP